MYEMRPVYPTENPFPPTLKKLKFSIYCAILITFLMGPGGGQRDPISKIQKILIQNRTVVSTHTENFSILTQLETVQKSYELNPTEPHTKR